VRTLISSITEQSAVLDVEELLPKIIVYLKRCKQSQSISMLKNLIERSNEKNAWQEPRENTLHLIESYSEFFKSTITSVCIGKISNFFINLRYLLANILNFSQISN